MKKMTRAVLTLFVLSLALSSAALACPLDAKSGGVGPGAGLSDPE